MDSAVREDLEAELIVKHKVRRSKRVKLSLFLPFISFLLEYRYTRK